MNRTILKEERRGERSFRKWTEFFSEAKEKKKSLKIPGKFKIQKSNVEEASSHDFHFQVKVEFCWLAWGRGVGRG